VNDHGAAIGVAEVGDREAVGGRGQDAVAVGVDQQAGKVADVRGMRRPGRNQVTARGRESRRVTAADGVDVKSMIARPTSLRPVRCARLLRTGELMSNTQMIPVPHLGTSTIGYKLGEGYDASLPTLVMVNSFTTSVEQYRPQFADDKLTAAANLLAIEPYGHGQTRASYEQFTYWDSAIANLQVLDALDIPEAFVLGTSQGGWIAARMAILAPGTVKGIIPLGTSMDFESQRSRDLGCWDGIEFCTPAIDALAEPVGDDWVIPIEFVDAVLKEGLGEDVPPDERAFWHAT
jgi:pimeloyl-ACP methyl ester carboxylesterase